MIILTITFTFTLLLPHVKAVDVEITSISPETHRGKVGDAVHIVGTINTTGGLYRIWFHSQKVSEANATENNVDMTFSVPPFPKENYTITLQDVSVNINATTWFYIDTAYYISFNKAKMPKPPEQLQENSTVEIWVNVTGGERDTIYSANITVNVPTPANETYWKLVPLTSTTNTGNGTATSVYPNNFTGTPHINYTGTYTVAFNKTLATITFSIGLTNSTEYHRFQYVDIRAAGYKPNENVTIKISFEGKAIHSEENLTATEGGLIYANWTVPRNASIGTYTLNITSTLNLTSKLPPDIQNFIVPGFDINITTQNLARETVPNVTVRVFEEGKSVLNGTSTSDGLVRIKLEIGNYTSEAYYKGEKVDERWVNVTDAASLDFACNLTNLKILVVGVVDGAEIGVPEAKIYLTPENQSLTTNVTGAAVFHSLLPNVTYALNASRYDMQFNVTTIPRLLVNETAIAWFNVTIICPTLTLQVNVTGANGQPISNAIVKVQELMGGLYYEGNTTIKGIFILDWIFGKYKVGVYASGVKLNETTVDLFQNLNISIHCKLYGLTVSVKVVDYFGQPISNANVTLQREGLAPRSTLTQSNGTATFSNIIGGNFSMAVYLIDQTQPCVTKAFSVDKSATIEIKIEKYVMLAGFLVETGQLAIAIIIAAAVILVLLMEVYRRKRIKPQKGSS